MTESARTGTQDLRRRAVALRSSIANFATRPTAWRLHRSPFVIQSRNAAVVIPSGNAAIVIPSRNPPIVIPSRRRGISTFRNAEIPRVRSG